MDAEGRRIAAVISTLGLNDTLANARASLRPTGASGSDVELWSEELPLLSLGNSQTDTGEPGRGRAQLELRGVLGEGGMGVVHLAVQTTLAREVAVKSARPGPNLRAAGMALVQEAVVTGQLEHPNMVPVHALGRDAAGVPLLVMKRVEGTLWSDLLHDPAHPAWQGMQGSVTDPLEWHLGVLMQVAQAVHFAHSRGYIHRDLKPDNVMIGRFGEVYVLDWGLAVRLEPRTALPASSAGGQGQLVGTPAYMAPEMALGWPQDIGVRTDVYLLGALLHEILTGQPPHLGTLGQALLSAHLSTPAVFDPEVPREMAVLCHRAMHREPATRHGSAEELRQALGHFLKQRSSLQLADRASSRVQDLEQLLQAGTADPVALYRLFGECRFGFHESMRAAPGNVVAREGLDRCVRRLADYELARRNPEAAAAVVAELAEPPAELLIRIEALRGQVRAEAEELEKLRARERERDASIGSRARGLAAVTAGLLLAAAVLAWFSWRAEGFHLTVMDGVRISLAVDVGLLMAGWVVRRQVLANQASRRIALALLVAATSLVGHRLLCLLTLPMVSSMLATDLFILGVTAAMGAVTLDRRLLFAAVWLLGMAVVLALHPARALSLFIIGNLGGLIAAALVWHFHDPEAAGRPPTGPPSSPGS